MLKKIKIPILGDTGLCHVEKRWYFCTRFSSGNIPFRDEPPKINNVYKQ